MKLHALKKLLYLQTRFYEDSNSWPKEVNIHHERSTQVLPGLSVITQKQLTKGLNPSATGEKEHPLD